MAHKKPPAFLRVVEPPLPQTRVRAEDFSPATWQATLFAQENPSLLVFIDFDRVTESDFLTVLVAARPRFVVDLRLAPHFDVGATNRRMVFSLFAQHATKYFDLSGRLGLRDHKDARLNPKLLAGIVGDLVAERQLPIVGPICFLVDHIHFEDSFVRALTEAMSPSFSIACEILKVPYPIAAIEKASNTSARPRRLVFISHANPEDNDFTRWLSIRLASAGYEVWSDVTMLLGGEQIWDTIEDAIRRHASKVVVVLSHKSQTKFGMLDEINCAISVERSSGMDGFVIPIRVDDLPFADVRANLARKNIIDFKDNWAEGLAQLLQTLEREGVPRSASDGSDKVATFYRDRAKASALLTNAPEQLVSNWLTIMNFPETVQLYSSNASLSELGTLTKQLKVPNFRYLRLIGAFAESADIQGDLPPEIGLQVQYRIPTNKFLAGATRELPGMQWREAHNIFSSLTRQAWNSFAASRGLQPYHISSGAVAWFVPRGLLETDRVSFHDAAGKSRRKQLLGWSDRRKVHWHYAVELRPALGRFPRMVLRPHVVFTQDGATLLDSKERMHALRRRFCKNWWNDRWRDLAIAYLSWLAGGATMDLPCGSTAAVTVSAIPQVFEAPVSLAEVGLETLTEEPNDIAELDDDDPVDDWFELNPVGDVGEAPDSLT